MRKACETLRAGFYLSKNLRSQTHVYFLEQIKGEHGCVMEVALEKVALTELDQMSHLRGGGVFAFATNSGTISIPTPRAPKVVAARITSMSITAAAGRKPHRSLHRGHPQHEIDNRLRRRDKGDVRFPRSGRGDRGKLRGANTGQQCTNSDDNSEATSHGRSRCLRLLLRIQFEVDLHVIVTGGSETG